MTETNVSSSTAFSCGMTAPGQPADFIVLALVTVACIPFLAGNILLLVHRDYFPIKVKGVDLILASSVGGFIWLVASFVVNNHFGRVGFLLDRCPLWTFWMQLCFGVSLWLNCFNVRLLNLYLIFLCKRDPITPIWVPLSILQSPMIIFSGFATVFKACSYVSAVDEDGNEIADCKLMSPGWISGTLIVLALYFILMVTLGTKLRNIMAPYNEYRMIREGAFILFFLAGVAIQRCIRFEVTGRAFLTLAVSYVVFYYFWMRNGLVVYKVLFHKTAYEKEFKDKFQEAMNKTSLVDERGFSMEMPVSSVAREEIASHTMDFSSTFNADVEAVVRTSRLDVVKCKEIIDQQKEMIRMLRERVSLLEGEEVAGSGREDGGVSGTMGRRARTFGYEDPITMEDVSGGFWRFGRRQSRIGRSGPIEKSAPLLRGGIPLSGPILSSSKTPRYATADWCMDTPSLQSEPPRKDSAAKDGREVGSVGSAREVRDVGSATPRSSSAGGTPTRGMSASGGSGLLVGERHVGAIPPPPGREGRAEIQRANSMGARDGTTRGTTSPSLGSQDTNLL